MLPNHETEGICLTTRTPCILQMNLTAIKIRQLNDRFFSKSTKRAMCGECCLMMEWKGHVSLQGHTVYCKYHYLADHTVLDQFSSKNNFR